MLRWISRGSTLLFLVFLCMANLVIYFGVQQEQFLRCLAVQGLILNTIGAVIIALPDVNQLHDRTTPEPLHTGYNTLLKKAELKEGDPGFDAVLNLIDEHTSRVRGRDYIRMSVPPVGDYGTRTIKATEKGDRPPRWQLTDTQLLQQWIAQKRGEKYRIPGIIVLGSGFLFQLASYLF